MEDIGKLDKRLSTQTNVVPPYTGSIHKSNVNASNVNKTLPPRTTSSTTSASNSTSKGHKILGKW